MAKSKIGSSNRQLTSPFEFIETSKMFFSNIIKVVAAKTSMICGNCGIENKKNSALEFNCQVLDANDNDIGCGKLLHRDRNACQEILKRGLDKLAASASMTVKDAEVLESIKPMKSMSCNKAKKSRSNSKNYTNESLANYEINS